MQQRFEILDSPKSSYSRSPLSPSRGLSDESVIRRSVVADHDGDDDDDDDDVNMENGERSSGRDRGAKTNH